MATGAAVEGGRGLNRYTGRNDILPVDLFVYDGVDQTKKTWGKIDTYGPKLVENIVQAISRDCLAVSMLRLDAAGFEAGP